jgi:hypothetical protein
MQTATAALGVLIALGVAYIAWQNYAINLNKLKLDLFDRRMRVFNALQTLLIHTIREGRIDGTKIEAYRADMWLSEFLFDKSVHQFLSEFFDKSVELMNAGDQLDGMQADDPDRSAVIKKKYDTLRWLTSRGDKIRAAFRPFLTIETPVHPWQRKK